jgi:hypothetical protein
MALPADERELAEQRALGKDWNEIATQRGERPDTLRKRLTQALNRVVRQIGIDPDPEVDDA